MSLINTAVQPFKVQAYQNCKFIEVTEQKLKGRWSAFVFMPAAFTFNCPTEVEDLADNYSAFQKKEMRSTSSPPTRISRTRCGTRRPRRWASRSSRWWVTPRTS